MKSRSRSKESKPKFKFERPVHRLTAVNQIDVLVGSESETNPFINRKIYHSVFDDVEVEIDYYKGSATMLRARTQEELERAYKYIANTPLPIPAGSSGYRVPLKRKIN